MSVLGAHLPAATTNKLFVLLQELDGLLQAVGLDAKLRELLVDPICQLDRRHAKQDADKENTSNQSLDDCVPVPQRIRRGVVEAQVEEEAEDSQKDTGQASHQTDETRVVQDVVPPTKAVTLLFQITMQFLVVGPGIDDLGGGGHDILQKDVVGFRQSVSSDVDSPVPTT